MIQLQTLLPLATAYSPPLVSVLVPFFGLHFPYIADLHPLFCGIHPIIDGCVLIYTIKQYRCLGLYYFPAQPINQIAIRIVSSDAIEMMLFLVFQKNARQLVSLLSTDNNDFHSQQCFGHLECLIACFMNSFSVTIAIQ